MKKRILFLLGATLLMSSFSWTQSKKYVMLEHFTQASCGPCASANPVFEPLRLANEGTVHHIAWHTSWPGTDPMNAHNATQIDTYVSTYGISGVPSMIMLGNQWQGSPASITQAQIDAAAAPGAPIKVKVYETDNGTSRDVDIEIHTTGIAPTGFFIVRAAVIEGMVTYGTPPGSNGETEFPNVFRTFINGMSGESFTPAASGNSVTFNYTYNEDPAWDPNEIYVIAWVEELTSDEIINSGSNLDPNWELNNFSNQVLEGANGNVTTFNGGISNDGSAPEEYRLTLTSNEPNDWSSEILIGGNSFGSTVDTVVSGTTLLNFEISVTPGATPFVAEYTVELESLDDPAASHHISRSYTISGITDLVVTNGGEADLSEQVFTDGLASTGNSAYGVMPAALFEPAQNANQLTNVNNIYYNVGWTFPCFDEDMIDALEAFNDNGGNIFMAGQDIAWSSFDLASPYESIPSRQYLINYMGIGFVDDGSSANSTMDPMASDVVFGTAPSLALQDIHGGNMYPDEITTQNSGEAIYYYNGNPSQIGAVRQLLSSHKSVFFGIDMGMIQNSANAENIIAISHDWFYGLLSTEEFDNAFSNLSAYPNPAANQTKIVFSELKSDAELRVTDITGKLVFQTSLEEGSIDYNLNVSLFENGTYFYTISNDKGVSGTRQIQVTK